MNLAVEYRLCNALYRLRHSTRVPVGVAEQELLAALDKALQVLHVHLALGVALRLDGWAHEVNNSASGAVSMTRGERETWHGMICIGLHSLAV